MDIDKTTLAQVLTFKLILLTILGALTYAARNGYQDYVAGPAILFMVLAVPWLLFEWKSSPLWFVKGCGWLLAMMGIKLLPLPPFFIGAFIAYLIYGDWSMSLSGALMG